MADLDSRLTAIFRAAFAGMTAEQATKATRDSVEKWDSIAAMTLASLLEEEFGQQFDLDEAAEWTSYAAVRAAVEKRVGG
jgi:acyl carrier protein